MNEQLDAIEIACTDALKALKDEQDLLDQRIRAMDEMKAQVAEAVYLRVRADYVARREQLEAQARPLREKARAEYARLSTILDELVRAHEAVQLDKQELELRHRLGEFDAAEFERRVKAIDTAAAEKSALHERAQQMRERFLGAVRGEEELRVVTAVASSAPAAAPAPAPAPAAGYTTGEMAPPGRVPDTTQPVAAVPATMVMPTIKPAAAPAPAPVEGTMVMPAIPRGAAAPPAPAAPAPAAPIVSEATVMFRPSRLVPQNPEAGKTTHNLALKPINFGSDPANEVRLGGPGVEARHAQLMPTPKGYVLTDLDTKHGTRVNAEKIKEKVLANEDVIQIGAARFVFRSA